MRGHEWSNLLEECNRMLSETQQGLSPNEARKIHLEYTTGLQEGKSISRDGLQFQNAALGNG